MLLMSKLNAVVTTIQHHNTTSSYRVVFSTNTAVDEPVKCFGRRPYPAARHSTPAMSHHKRDSNITLLKTFGYMIWCYWSGMPASLTTLPSLTTSDFIKAAKSSGEFPFGSAPDSRIFCFTSGKLMARTIS